jgi:hypothetical protein
MARLLSYVLSAVLSMNISLAHANFVIQSPSADTGPDFVNSGSDGDPVPSGADVSSQPVRWKMAYGFGNNIPLAFACQQIVPPAVKVTYGPGVNPAIPVTWRGGDTWNHVLRDTVKPLGLRLQMTFMAVTIVKTPPR